MTDLTQLANPNVLTLFIGQFSNLYPGCNSAAITSQWSMDYFTVLLPGLFAPALISKSAIQVWKLGVELLHDNSQLIGLKIQSEQPSLLVDSWPQYVHQLIYDHLEPVLLNLSAVGNIAPKVLWNNFVAVWDISFERLRNSFPHQKELESAQLCLQAMTVSNGKIQLRKLQQMVNSPAPELHKQIPVRKHCCLHYQLHAVVEGQFPVWCESCPKLHRRPPEEQACYLRQLHQENMEYMG